MEYIDIHSHILPLLDDGAGSEKESLALINVLKNQSVTKILATPHFYADIFDLNETLSNAIAALEKIKELTAGSSPEIKLGFEVHYFKNISACAQIKQLTLNNSSYLLLELSYKGLPDSVVNDIISLKLNLGITPVLAHIERYAKLSGFENVLETIDEGFAIGQINAPSICDKHTRKTALRLIESGYGTLIASDAHSLKTRPPEIDKAFKIIAAKLGENTVNKLKQANHAFYERIW